MKRLIPILFALFVNVAVVSSTWAATLYANFSSGNDTTGDGSSGTPYKTLNKCLSVANPGDTINLSGRFRETLNTIADASILIQTTPTDTDQAWITGNSVATTDSGVTVDVTKLWEGDSATYDSLTWTNVGAATDGNGGRYWSIPINSVPTDVVGVTVNWETQMDAFGRHYGHLKAVGAAATVASTESSYFIDTAPTPDVLYINPYGAITDMSGKAVRLVRQGSGLTAVTKNGLTFKRLSFGPHSDPDPDTTAYNMILDSCSNVTIERCRFYDGGYHNLGWTGSGNVENVYVYNSTAYGCRNTGATNWVVNTTAGVISNVVFEECGAVVYGRLSENNAELDSSLVQKGWYAHGAANSVRGVTLKNCSVLGTGAGNTTSYSFENTTQAADYKVWESYPVKLDHCTSLGTPGAVASATSVAMRRCMFNTEGFASAGGLNSNTTSVLWNQSTAGRMFAEACSFVTNTGRAATGGLRAIQWEGHLYFVNNLLLDYSTDDTNTDLDFMFWKVTGATKFWARGNVFARLNKTTGGTARTDGAGSLVNFNPAITGMTGWDNNITEVSIQYNGYVGISRPGYPGEVYDTWGEWTGSASPYTEYATTYYSDQSGTVQGAQVKWVLFNTTTGEPMPGSFFTTRRAAALTNSLVDEGINGREYDRSFGPWQFGDLVEGIGVPIIRNRSRP